MKYKLQHYKDALAEPMPAYIRHRIMDWDKRCIINGKTCNYVHVAYRNGDYIRVPVSIEAVIDPKKIAREFKKVCAASY